MDGDRLRANLAASIDADLTRLHAPERERQCHEALQIPGAGPDDYRQRCIEIDGELLIADIAFLGLDRTRPFVHVPHRTLAIESNAVRDAVRDLLASEFACFHPQRVSLPQSSHASYQFDGCEQDMRLVGAPLSVIRASEVTGLSSLRLQPVEDFNWYERYCAAYDTAHRDRPNIKDVATCESVEYFEAMMDSGEVFEVLVDDAWAGIYALEPDRRGGMDGFLVGECLLAEHARGRRLGPAMHVAWARGASDVPDDSCLFGTIGGVNRAALRAAKDAGRVDLGGNYWIDVPSSGR